MSIIGFDLLRNIVEVQGEKSPDRILSILNEGVVNTFNKKVHGSVSKTENVNDGMDMALILIDKKEQVIEFAGANNPLYIMRDNEILTVKGNRRPIGYQSELSESEQFSKQIIPYQSGDIVYLFTDGYADQFGGAEGKKFKYRRFRHLLLNIHKLPIDDQKTILHQKMEEWMGSEYEQIDDICLVGIKL